MKSPEFVSDAADKAKDQYNEVVDKAKDLYGDAADKAKGLLDEVSDIKVSKILDKGSDTLEDARDKAIKAYKKLSTTEKIVGGTLLALGLTYLVAPKKKGKDKRKKAALDQLLLFVNDRLEGYKKAAAESKDNDLRDYYKELVGQSQQFASSLNNYLTANGGKRETGTTLKGKLYRKLMDAQAAVTGHDEKSILASNVFGERWALKAYKQALRRKALKGEARAAIKKQFVASKKTYKKLKGLLAKQS